LDRLRVLRLERTPVSDRGIALLARAPALEALFLDSTRVTDTGAAALAGTHLRELGLAKTRV
jgi:hypothetical protein